MICGHIEAAVSDPHLQCGCDRIPPPLEANAHECALLGLNLQPQPWAKHHQPAWNAPSGARSYALDYSTETKSAYMHASVSAVAFAGFCRPCMKLDTCMILDKCMTQDKGVGLV